MRNKINSCMLLGLISIMAGCSIPRESSLAQNEEKRYDEQQRGYPDRLTQEQTPPKQPGTMQK
jgi:hypothetical protein|uniref:hypothetical protein n=1 Tax=Cephaloticoccus sp. TaxID=1985742 RepID=UPI00404B55B9